MEELEHQRKSNYVMYKLQEEYSNIEELGNGTFSTVYSAIHRLSSLPVCLKVFEPSSQSTSSSSFGSSSYIDDTLELVENEISIMKKLDHPFITKYYGMLYIPSKQEEDPTASFPPLSPLSPFHPSLKLSNVKFENPAKYLANSPLQIRVRKHEDNVEKGIYIIVMELIKGTNLLNFINRYGKIDEQEACRIFSQIVEAFYYLQSDGVNVVHRDVKLENIMLDENFNVRIIDFGFSKSVSDQQDLLKTQCGSYPYSAPELLQNSLYTKAVDVWSLGVILFAMVNAYLPFEDPNMLSLTNKILYMNPKFSDDLSHSCIDLISRMLDKNPENRITLKEVKEHEWMKGLNSISYGDDFAKKFQTKRLVSFNSSDEIETPQANFDYLNIDFQKYSSTPTFIYDSLTLHETAKVLAKSNEQVIEELNIFDMTDAKFDIHHLIKLYKYNPDFRSICQTKLINRIFENKSKSKKLNILINLRMNNGNVKVLSNQEINTKLPMLNNVPLKKKETQVIMYNVKNFNKKGKTPFHFNQNQATKYLPKKRPISILGKIKMIGS